MEKEKKAPDPRKSKPELKSLFNRPSKKPWRPSLKIISGTPRTEKPLPTIPATVMRKRRSGPIPGIWTSRFPATARAILNLN